MARGKSGKTNAPPPATSATTATRAANEWGIPDWRDPAAYGDVKRWTFNRWRWEFYRRRNDLREYFDARAEETFRYWVGHAGKPGFPVAHLRPEEPGFAAIVDMEARARFGYSALPNPRIGNQWENRLHPFENDGTVKAVDGGFVGRDGVADTVGKRFAEAAVILTEAQSLRLQFVLSCHFVELNKDQVALVFDLNRPLEPQISNAREVLQAHYDISQKPMQRRRHPSKWLGYPSIGKRLCPNTTNCPKSEIWMNLDQLDTLPPHDCRDNDYQTCRSVLLFRRAGRDRDRTSA